MVSRGATGAAVPAGGAAEECKVVMSQPIISVKALEKVYVMGDVQVQALRGVDVDIQKNEFVSIMGASGSGKSTFMNILGCLDVLSGGVYYLDGEDVSTLSKEQLAYTRNRKIGFVFQSFNLLSRTTALENVELPLFYESDISSRQMQERALQALEAVGMEDRAHHFPSQLSGGQQQRVAIARSLVTEPVMILADEPTGNLDTQTSSEVMEIFQGLNEKGMTIVLVTHEHDIAEYSKRRIVFRDGKIIKESFIENRRNAREERAAMKEHA